jgi:rubredoxin
MMPVAAAQQATPSEETMAIYECPECGFTYDESKGNPREGFPPGTPFAEIPADWNCPDCGVRDQVDFELVDAGAGTPS